MTAPQPEDAGIAWKLLAGVGTALSALGIWAWTYTHNLIAGKAEMKTLDALAKRVEDHTISREVFDQHAKNDEQQLMSIREELDTQRNTTAKIFDQMHDIESTMNTNHVALLNAIYDLKK